MTSCRRIGKVPFSPTSRSSRKLSVLVTYGLTFSTIRNFRTPLVQDAYLIDVREPDEVVQGSIPSSVNLPLSVLANSLNLNAQAFRSQHGFDKPGKAQEVVFYCRSGKRSASACDIARRNGYEKWVFPSSDIHLHTNQLLHSIINYEGSWLDWVSREGDGKGSSA